MVWLSALVPMLFALGLVAFVVAVVRRPRDGMTPHEGAAAIGPADRLRPPKRVVEAAQLGIRAALSGNTSRISDRLWAYEIEEAARQLVEQWGAAGQIAVRTTGDTVLFEPAAAARERPWPAITP
jgi:hypothetical protein